MSVVHPAANLTPIFWNKWRVFQSIPAVVATVLAILIAGILLPACGIFSLGNVGPATIVQKENGYLVELPGCDSEALVEALVTHRHWVIVTIVDPAYNLSSVEQLSSPVVDSLDVVRFPSAAQVSLRFVPEIERATVVSRPGDPSIVVSVFTR